MRDGLGRRRPDGDVIVGGGVGICIVGGGGVRICIGVGCCFFKGGISQAMVVVSVRVSPPLWEGKRHG